MPDEMPQAAMARAPRIVYRFNARLKQDLISAPAEAEAQVNIFVIHEVTLVKPPYLPEHFAAEQHEYSCDPIGMKRRIADFVVQTAAHAKHFLREAEKSRKRPCAVLCRSLRVQDFWSDDADAPRSQSLEQDEEGVVV